MRQRPTNLLAQVAASLDAPPSLGPYVTELCRDLDSLGSVPREVASCLRRAGVGDGDRVLDLGCGKGAAAAEVAGSLGCRVTGVDAHAPFIEAARSLARARGLSGRCRFITGDVRAFTRSPRRFDAAIMLGLFALSEAASLLRPCTRRGGVYIIDDCYWDDRQFPRRVHPPGWFTRAESVKLIEASGDVVEEMLTAPPSSIRRLNSRLYAQLALRARELAREHPRLRPSLADFLARQRAANRLLGGPLRPSLWVVRKH